MPPLWTEPTVSPAYFEECSCCRTPSKVTMVDGLCWSCLKSAQPYGPPVILCSSCGEPLVPVKTEGALHTRYYCQPCGRTLP